MDSLKKQADKLLGDEEKETIEELLKAVKKQNKDTTGENKELHEKRSKAQARYDELIYAGKQDEATEAWQETSEYDQLAQEKLEHLSIAIDDEYRDVPFQQTRNKGIAGFWRESGLAKLYPSFCSVLRR